RALETETTERNRFYRERTRDTLDTLATRIDVDPDQFENVVQQGVDVIESWPIGDALKEQYSADWQKQAAAAYGQALL
ncbi:hypothetical protein ABTI79_20390, partial [Acinetobacter baumannii]